MSIARTFALQYEYATDSNQELYALGVANIVGAFFLSYPIAGSLSRSALVAETAQAHCTPMHGVVTACLVLLVLLLLTPAFRPMPRACLASIVFMAVRSLFDLRKPIELYRVKRADCELGRRLRRHSPPRGPARHRRRRPDFADRDHLTLCTAEARHARAAATHQSLPRRPALRGRGHDPWRRSLPLRGLVTLCEQGLLRLRGCEGPSTRPLRRRP